MVTQATRDEVETKRAASVQRRQERQQRVDEFQSGMTQIQSDLDFITSAIATNTNLTQGQIKVGFQHILTQMRWLGDRIADGTIEISESRPMAAAPTGPIGV